MRESRSDRFQAAIKRFAAANAQDPNRETVDGVDRPREQVHAEWLAAWVERLNPNGSEALHLAAHCQHIRRWEIPRDSYPATREGYLRWRELLKKHHADIASGILADVGYEPELIERVRAMNLKKNLKQDPDCQTIEDALCLVFLEHQFEFLAAKTSEEKLLTAVRKTWDKMSLAGRAAALALPLPASTRALVEKALQNS
jgi:hypothetical protein